MKNAITIPDDGNARLAQLREQTTEDLKESLVNCVKRTVADILDTAYHLRVLEERGEDLRGLKLGLYDHLRKVAHGQLLPEVLVHFAGKPSLIAIVGNLPLPDQKRLAGGEYVRLLVHGSDGQQTHRMADPMALTPEQTRQVFARDHIRREDEQALILTSQRQEASKPIPEKVGKLRVDRERQVATYGSAVFPLADLKLVVRLLEKS